MVKPDNIVTFISEIYDRVHLVRKSIGYYRDRILPNKKIITYWRGQLAEPMISGERPFGMDVLWPKGKVVWLDATEFKLKTPPLALEEQFPDDMNESDIIDLFVQGAETFVLIRWIDGAGWCGVEKKVFGEYDLKYGMGRMSSRGFYSYRNFTDVLNGFINWNGLNDPPGAWVSHKSQGLKFTRNEKNND